MDWIENRSRATDFLKKYKFVFCVVILGMFLMMLQENSEDTEPTKEIQEVQSNELQNSLEKILSKIDGAGKVSVLLTEFSGEQTVYQLDETNSSTSDNSDIKQETVIISDSNRDESGLIRQIISPVYQGAIVVCQGADRAAVRLAIVEAVSKVTGLSSNQISVLKMK